ncbi:hypothetical protein DVR12_18560 [Chitinophaga silvatica]|uniref:Uncharacterized protein n=1 Tax=Chitinophaga silvatica TaxID=2282649 RepID=A0A3E1Y6K5_9BACT|nr:hypothetical protein [Chitinophaga silvatica]RFS20565.1 hypothetical protein DVR12_18560 [Chitinophaga silvatica]
MPKLFHKCWSVIKNIYLNAEKMVIGNVIQRTDNLYEQAKIKLLFDYAFFYIIILSCLQIVNIIAQNLVNLIVIPFMISMLIAGLMLIHKGVASNKVGSFISLATLITPMFSSLFNEQDLSPKYTMIWVMSILLCYITVNLRTALIWSGILCAYLGVVAYLKVNQLQIFVSPGYSPGFQYLANPIVAGMYLLFLIRALGQYYRNVIRMQHWNMMEQQKQQLTLVNQHLTKQFILVKGFSKSGRTAFSNGELELLDTCFSEIEKQCKTAIDYLNDPKVRL